ncbi:MAG: hypothetical protein DI533_15720 [Cereibacter sphaeroides]|uniref:Uncharacterized protein n=1 Tax=Cereibacter sphaeroides TaxID=1063 RepID=A0A2W5TMM2_CERSP|nr:MAG: hypothetical protein DI533_15720 [Cereibacter sphaeroides]
MKNLESGYRVIDRRMAISVACGLLAAATLAFAPPGQFLALVLIMVTGAIALSTLGRRIPVLRGLGGDALLTLLVPSWFVHIGAFRPLDLQTMAHAFEAAHALEFFVTVIVAGGILSTDRAGLRRAGAMILPLAAMTTLAVIAFGLTAGLMTGQDMSKVFFFILCPMLSGGLAVGLVPLSIGYASAFATTPAAVMASILPPLLLSNIAMILISGALSYRADKTTDIGPQTKEAVKATLSDLPNLAIGTLFFLGFFLLALIVSRHTAINLPLGVILMAVALGFTGLLPGWLADAVATTYRLVVRYLTFPLIFSVGMIYTPWGPLIEGLAPARLVVICAGLAGVCAAGLALARITSRPVNEMVTLAATRVAMGGSGALAILQAARRLDLMPQAQIALRIGGVAMVSIALLLA